MSPRPDSSLFAENFSRASAQAQQILQEFAARQLENTENQPAMPDPLNLVGPFTELFARLASDPVRLLQWQQQCWQDGMALWQHTARMLAGEPAPPVIAPDPKDRRFRDAAWQEHPLFDFMKQSYLLSAKWLQTAVRDVPGLSPHDAQKVDFYTRQFIDAVAPSNFLMTNPEALRVTLETGGENLVQGLQNVLEDLERGKISMTDERAFEVGKNLAVTPGKVVFRNELMELIQYTPTTEKVLQTPLLVIPAWINKFYILDLQPENSMVKWLLDKGHTVFVISWVNPDEKLAQKTFDDYVLQGPIAAMEAIEKATGEKKISIAGYCLGGTLLAITLSYLHAKNMADRVVSATYLTTMVDFAEAGELGIFVDEEQLQAMESQMAKKGYLEGSAMAGTFNSLRANDLIWSFVVNNYLLGRDPFPFDLLYWNSDSTRMPAAMHSFYLRNMYQKNLLVKAGALTIAGVPVDLARITTPSYILSCREDHIAPWKSTYAATQLYHGNVTFVLAASGHIAGVVNHPAKNKYVHWTNENLPPQPDDWLAGSTENPGSWWPHWDAWQRQFAGAEVTARIPGDGGLRAIENAPGSYVKVGG